MFKTITYKENEDTFKKLLNHFLFENKNSLNSFRYFNKRDLNVLENHIYTSLYLQDDDVLGYGHLDYESEKVWLGIIVSEKKRNIGIGKFIMNDLLKQYNGDIFLTVDSNNDKAIKLYISKNFYILERKNKILLMKNNI